jgi:hypothetical protein
VHDLPHIRAVYLQIDSDFEQRRSEAAAINDGHAVSNIENKQRINDQAYFVLAWGQLETEIDRSCRQAIRSRAASGNWQIRRAWDLYNPDDNRMSGLKFEDKTALVLDRKQGQGSPWARVMSYYNLRNQIAHGTLLAQRIDVDSVIQEFFQIQRRVGFLRQADALSHASGPGWQDGPGIHVSVRSRPNAATALD